MLMLIIEVIENIHCHIRTMTCTLGCCAYTCKARDKILYIHNEQVPSKFPTIVAVRSSWVYIDQSAANPIPGDLEDLAGV